MAIETGSNSSPAHKANGSADARAAKAKSSADAPGADAGAPGFMDILSSVGDVPADGNAPSAATTDGSGDAATGQALPDAAALMAQSLQTPDAQAATHAASSETTVATAKPAALARPDSALATDPALPGVAESRTKGLQRAVNQAKSDKAAGAPEAPGSASGCAAQPAHDFKLFTAMEAQRNLQSAPEPEVVVASLGAKPEKSTAERSLFAKQSSDATYSVPGASLGSAEYASSAPIDVAPVLETQAAEQVKYWISQDVQNAELQLDGLGERPVEVSISMQGNEAHVAFRTDELQTHSLLEGAGAQLKDMLLREGVVLAGVSVGTSGTNDGKGGDRRPRPGMKVAPMTAAPAAPVVSGRRMAGFAGRSVDLFV